MIADVTDATGRLPTPPNPGARSPSGSNLTHDQPSGRPGNKRFTLDGDDALEQHLERTCARVVSGLRGLLPAAKLDAILLGGGYGRGEGGVLRGPDGDRPYNDLEFYVAIAGNRHVNQARYHRRLEVLGEILTQLAGVQIEFKITSRAAMTAPPVSMFSYDLVTGHRLLYSRGPWPELTGPSAHRSAEDIPSVEATRLLMNRCSGLLFARAQLEPARFTAADADFVRRNIAKVQLACGDAVLTACGRYHWRCGERHHRLQLLAVSEPSPWLDAVLRHHAVGVAFKFHPTTGETSREALTALHQEITALALQCWLTLEARRTGRAFPTARAYAEDPKDKLAGSPRLRNVLLNWRANHFRFRAHPRPWWHPRQRIFRALTLLLWEPATFSDPALRRRLELELNAPAATPAAALAAYRDLWARVR